MQRVLVTGGAGFMGSHVVEALVTRGFEVRVLDDLSRGDASNLAACLSDIDFIEGDITDVGTMNRSLDGIDTVFHFAAINGTHLFYDIPDQILVHGLRACLSLFESLPASKVERIVLASSAEVYGLPRLFPTSEDHPLSIPDPRNPRWTYAATKILDELLLLHGFSGTSLILRYHNCYGPRMKRGHVIPDIIYGLLDGSRIKLQGTGSETRSFCYISDAVEATLLAAAADTDESLILNIGNAEETSISELVRMLELICGESISKEYAPFPNPGTSRRLPSIKRAQSHLGWTPRFSLEEGLRLTYSWFRQSHLQES